MSTIEIDSLRKEFNVHRGMEVAVDNVNIDIEQGEFFTLVGPSGCGKTTTLRCVAGLETPTSGRISIDGEDITDTPSHRRDIAMMFQNIALYPHMQIKDNISYPLKVDGVSLEERYERAQEAAELMQISELLDKYPGELSGGQRQRAALARTIVQDPVAFLMDEPLSDLDAKLKIDVREEIQRVHRNLDKPTVYVTHDQEEAMSMSDRLAVMNDGHLEQVGSPTELYHHPENRFVAEFLGAPSMNFIHGELRSLTDQEAAIKIRDVTITFPLEYAHDAEEGTEVAVGFRPQTVGVNEDGSGDFEANISLIEPVGDRTLLTIDAPFGVLRAVAPGITTLEEDRTETFSIDRSGIYLFDTDTDELLAKGGDQVQAPTHKN